MQILHAVFWLIVFYCEALRADVPSQVEHLLLRGTLTAKYYLMNGYVPYELPDEKNPKGKPFIFILNRCGQIVWSYSPPHSQATPDHRTRTILAKQIGDVHFGILIPYENSRFLKVSWDGSVAQDTSMKEISSGIPAHHDFILREGNRLITFGQSLSYSRKPWKLFRNIASYLSTPLMEIDLSTNTTKTIWDYDPGKPPHEDSDWTWNEKDSGLFWTSWNKEKAQNDFTHANSISYRPGEGFLLSLRNLNKLVMLSEDFQSTLWTIGPSSSNSISTKGKDFEFYRQHHAELIGPNQLLVFDNGKNQSRIVELKIELEEKKASLIRAYTPEPVLHSSRHGSNFVLNSGNIVGYFPNTTPGKKERNYIVEFDRQTGKEIARIGYDLGYNAAGYRAEPLNDALIEKALKGKLPKCN